MTERARASLPWDPLEMAAAARAELTPEAATYFETTAVFPPTHDNEAAWAEWRFVPRVARDVGSVSTGGRAARRDHARADPARPVRVRRSRASGRRVRGGPSRRVDAERPTSCPAVEHASARRGRRVRAGACWLQLYVPRDERARARPSPRAAEAGFGAVVVTVDAPVASIRTARIRSRSGIRRSDATCAAARVAAQPVGHVVDD